MTLTNKQGHKQDLTSVTLKTRAVVLTLWVTTIGKHVFPTVLGTEILLSNKISYEGTKKIKLWFGVPKTVENMCFMMTVIHRLRTAELEGKS